MTVGHTVEFEVKKQILLDALSINKDAFIMPNDDELIDWFDDNGEEFGEIDDAFYDFRHTGENTCLRAPLSRHYEVDQVARKLDSGVSISWSYWYGGGKFGEPEAIDWISDAYFVDCVEEEVTIVKRTYSKKGN